ncbi:MAG: EF-P beta-lysylation protein EpmB [Pseudohongiellaceae bacterium]
MSSTGLSLHNCGTAQKWQQILSDLVTDPKELLQILELDPSRLPVSGRVLAGFPLKVPRPFIARMEKGNPADPLLAQVLPVNRELESHTGFCHDPLAETQYNPAPGLLQKYQGRALLTVAPHCTVHCRYCFRRHFDYASNTPARSEWRQALDYIAADSELTEVIFSGGDPLACSDRQLAWLAEAVADIPHVRRLRIHSRTPIMIPQRVTGELLRWMTGTRLKTVLVLHCNHAREIDDEVGQALGLLHASGITLLNQSVLLKGVNDSVTALKQLSESLFEKNVLPYYLHLLDRVEGVGHFDVAETEAVGLLRELRGHLPGYLVPRLAKEVPGEGAKTLIA